MMNSSNGSDCIERKSIAIEDTTNTVGFNELESLLTFCFWGIDDSSPLTPVLSVGPLVPITKPQVITPR